MEYKVLALMSGTSLDGIDLAYCSYRISDMKDWEFDIITAKTVEYSNAWRIKLGQAISFSQDQLHDLDEQYMIYLSETINTYLTELNLIEIDAICSHGHTILHRPDLGYTLQIGNLPKLAQLVEQTVVCDFRVQDVALGGQGAPLVPIGDKLLFGQYDYCLNLGGFANVSFEKNGQRMAYDICPVNVVLNQYAEKLNMTFDKGGAVAASGDINQKTFEKLNDLEYYAQEAPKSLGIEWVNQNIFPILDAENDIPKNVLRTFIEHVSLQLSMQFKEDATVLVTGGGAYNDFLLKQVRSNSKTQFIVPSKKIIEYKEALIFGFLGVLKLRGEINCLASVTGATKDHSSGNVFLP